MATSRAPRGSSTSPRQQVPVSGTGRSGGRPDVDDDPRATAAGSDLAPPLPVIDQQCREIAAAAAALRHRLVMGRYAGFAAGFDAGLAVCGMLDTLSRDHTRSQGTQRLRADALALARHVNADLGADHDPIQGGPTTTPPP